MLAYGVASAVMSLFPLAAAAVTALVVRWAVGDAASIGTATARALAAVPNSNHDAVVRSPQAFAALLMPFLARH